MKQQKKNLLIVVLMLALVWSIVLNWLQSEQVDRLMSEIEDMEYLQTELTSYFNELEDNKNANDGY